MRLQQIRGRLWESATGAGQRFGFPIIVVGLAALTMLACPPPAEESRKAALEEIPVTTSSQEARSLFEDGQYFLDVGRGVEARDKFQAAIEADPDFTYAYFNLSNASLSGMEFQENLDKALETVDGKSDGERLLVEMNRTFLNNDWDRGLELGQQLVDAYPNSARASLALSGIQGVRNDNEGARESMKKGLELDPESVAALFGLGNSYLFGEPRDFGEAERYMRKLIEVRADEAKGYEGLGDVMRAQKDLKAALEAYTQATDRDPKLAVAQLKKGHVNSFLGNIDKARGAYDAAIDSARPENKAAYANYRAFTHIHAGDVQGTLDELATLAESVEAMGTPPHQVKGIQVFILTNHATAALHSGRLDQAAEAIEMRNGLQRQIGAEMGTENAKRLNEANCLIWEGLLAAYRDDYDLAMKKAEENGKLLESDSNPRRMESYHQVTGLVYLRQGDFEKAAEHFRQADHTNTMYIRYHLALAEEGRGNTEEARKLFKEVAEWNFNSVGFALVHEDAAARGSS